MKEVKYSQKVWWNWSIIEEIKEHFVAPDSALLRVWEAEASTSMLAKYSPPIEFKT
jgi:hypothetical protein